MSSPKIVIAGTGRAGTTLLVQIMTDLGFDTGFQPGIGTQNPGRPGLEKNILAPNAPRVIKSPRLSSELGPMLEQGLVEIEHVIIPVRDLDVAAASRIRASSYGRSLNAHGGLLWGQKRASSQRGALADMLSQLLITVARFDVPHTLLYFPRFASDPQYTFQRLSPLDPNLTLDDYARVMHSRFDPAHVHEKPLDRAEQLQMKMSVPVAFAKRATGAVKRATRR